MTEERRPPQLTPRERQVLQLICSGVVRNRELAEHLIITEATVEFHVKQLMTKLDANNRVVLVARAFTSGLIDAA